jgi:hypothetical protein
MDRVIPEAPDCLFGELIFDKWIGDEPTFKLADPTRKTPGPPHPSLIFKYFDHRGIEVFGQKPQPMSQPGPLLNWPKWHRVLFGVRDLHSSLEWPHKNWTPANEAAEKVLAYYTKHKGDPRMKRTAWDPIGERVHEFDESAAVEPFPETPIYDAKRLPAIDRQGTGCNTAKLLANKEQHS